MFEYQGHWVKVRVISWEMLILLPGYQFNLSKVKIINEVRVIPRSNCKCLTFYQQVGEVGLRLKGILVGNKINFELFLYCVQQYKMKGNYFFQMSLL